MLGEIGAVLLSVVEENSKYSLKEVELQLNRL